MTREERNQIELARNEVSAKRKADVVSSKEFAERKKEREYQQAISQIYSSAKKLDW